MDDIENPFGNDDLNLSNDEDDDLVIPGGDDDDEEEEDWEPPTKVRRANFFLRKLTTSDVSLDPTDVSFG